MHPIERKSTGMLLDERITTGFKAEFLQSDEIDQRIIDLDVAIDERIGDRWKLINRTLVQLEHQLRKCWVAQEEVRIIKLTDDSREFDELWRLAFAGKEAQRTNAERNRLIRQLDELLGEGAIKPLVKTYA